MTTDLASTLLETVRLMLRGVVTVMLPVTVIAWLAGHLTMAFHLLTERHGTALQLAATTWVGGWAVAATLGIGSLLGARLCGLPRPHFATASLRIARVWVWLCWWLLIPAALVGGLGWLLTEPVEAWLAPYAAERASTPWASLPVRELALGLAAYAVVVTSSGIWLWFPAATLRAEGGVGDDVGAAHRLLQRTPGLEPLLFLSAIAVLALAIADFNGQNAALLLPALWSALTVAAVHRHGEPFRRAGGPRAATPPS